MLGSETPGSDTSLSLSLNLSPHKTGLCASVINNQEGTGGGTLVLTRVFVCVCGSIPVLLWETRFPWCVRMVSHSDGVCARVCQLPEHQPIINLPSGRERIYSVGSRCDHYTTTQRSNIEFNLICVSFLLNSLLQVF